MWGTRETLWGGEGSKKCNYTIFSKITPSHTVLDIGSNGGKFLIMMLNMSVINSSLIR